MISTGSGSLQEFQHHFVQTSAGVAKTSDAVHKEWASLKRIRVQELRIFETAHGAALHGTIVTPPLCMVRYQFFFYLVCVRTATAASTQ
jgi:hypothetical protein